MNLYEYPIKEIPELRDMSGTFSGTFSDQRLRLAGSRLRGLRRGEGKQWERPGGGLQP